MKTHKLLYNNLDLKQTDNQYDSVHWSVARPHQGIIFKNLTTSELFEKYLLDQIDFATDYVWKPEFNDWQHINTVVELQFNLNQENTNQTNICMSEDVDIAKPSTNNNMTKKYLTQQHVAEENKEEYNWLVNHYRLGSFKKTIKMGVTLPIITLSFSLIYWVYQTAKDMSFHMAMTNSANKRYTANHAFNYLYYTIGMFIPGLHILFAYLLAEKMLIIEQQNGYQHINPIKAALMWAIPLFAFGYVIYLQNALNVHWQWHIYKHYELVTQNEISQKKMAS